MAESLNKPARADEGDIIPRHDPSDSTNPTLSDLEVSDSEKVILAVYEGHDADIPSNLGYVLDEKGEQKRRQSIASQHRAALEKSEYKQSATADVERGSEEASADVNSANIVWWDSPDDPQNPLNFPAWVKTATMLLVSGICFVSPLASSMFAPGVPFLMEEFQSTNVELASFVVSVYVLGFAVGPLLFAPLSEIYGRLYIYHICNVGFVVLTVACAKATSLNMLIGFRFLEGVFGSAPLANGGGSIADIFVQEKRGLAMSLFSMGPIIGPVVGPIAGGYLSEAMGWRWVFWLLTMISGVFSICSVIFMRETYAPVILERKAKRLQKETGNLELRSKLDIGMSATDFFLRSIIRPAKLLIFSPVVLVTSLYVGVIYGYLYLLFTTFTLVFENTYGFSSGSVGLSYLGIGVGSLAGPGYFAVVSDRLLKKRAAEAAALAAETGQPSGGMKPEYRLPPLIVSSFLIPTGLFLYGWTAHYRVHYIVPILSTALIGIGNLAIFMCISTYLIDAYSRYAASALAANTVIRCILGAVLPLAGQKMYLTLGLGWGNSLLGFIACGLIPVTFGLIRWGEQLRNRFSVDNL